MNSMGLVNVKSMSVCVCTRARARACVCVCACVGVLSTECIDVHFNGYGAQQPLTPGMLGVRLASSPFDRLGLQNRTLGYSLGPALSPHES